MNNKYGLSGPQIAVLLALMSGEFAEPLPELARRVETSPAQVADVLDGLVQMDILGSDVFYHVSEIGEIDYAWSSSDYAQEIYDWLKEEN